MKTSPDYWIGELPVYPGHPVTCALVVLLAYPDDVAKAWEPAPPSGNHLCETELDTATGGGSLAAGCSLIRHVIDGMTPDEAILWGDSRWQAGEAGGHPKYVQPGQEQADRLKERLKEALRVPRAAARILKRLEDYGPATVFVCQLLSAGAAGLWDDEGEHYTVETEVIEKLTQGALQLIRNRVAVDGSVVRLIKQEGT